jgi:hypothetical protein
LRPVLEQVFADSRAALDSQDYGRALLLASGVLEAIITDALGNRDQGSGIGDQGTARFADSSFDARIAAAEAAGLIRGGCARLPAVARQYREFTEPDGTLRPGIDVSERDARVTGQVLQVVMRDLNPGR